MPNIRTGRSASAWILYIEFEAVFSPGKAKSLCYRALNHIGANKGESFRTCANVALLMLPFQDRLIQHMSKRELYDWVQVMLDRGIRLRLPIPLQAVEAHDADSLDGASEMDDDDED